MSTIKRNLVLKELDIKETPSGKQKTFSIKFSTIGGEYVFLPKAVSCGLPYSLKDNRQRGLVAVDHKGDKIGHVYPVRIDNLLEFNEMEVIL